MTTAPVHGRLTVHDMFPSPLTLIGHRHARQLLGHLRFTIQRGLKNAAIVKSELEASNLQFEACRGEGILFPELLEPGKHAVLVGVDPDIHGAVAVLRWHNPPSSAGSGASSSSSSQYATEAVAVSVHDMPIDIWELGSRSKRQPDPAVLLEILREHAGLDAPADSVVVRAVLEHTTPQHICGKYAWYGMGYSFGLLTGLLTSRGIPHHRVDASLWKRHLGLYRLGKEGSMALAKQLFPQSHTYLRRKKDHGRAEAMLIAAWGLGVRMVAAQPPASGPKDSRASADENAACSVGDACIDSSSASVEPIAEAGAELAVAPNKRQTRKKVSDAAQMGDACLDSRSARSEPSAEVAATPRKRRTRNKVAGE